MSKRRTEISIETHEITIIRTNGSDRGSTQQSGFCQFCQKTVPVFTPEKVASILAVSVNEICRSIEQKEIHLTDTKRRGVALICGNSLSERRSSEKPLFK